MADFCERKPINFPFALQLKIKNYERLIFYAANIVKPIFPPCKNRLRTAAAFKIEKNKKSTVRMPEKSRLKGENM